MKKTVLTFAVVAFGTCVAFAQTPVQEEQKTQTEQTITIDRMSQKPAEDEAGRRPIKQEELPVAVLRALKDGEFKDWKVVAVSELQANAQGQAVRENMAVVEGQADAQATAQPGAIFYEIELISEDMKDEVQDSQEATEEIVEEATEEGVVAEEKMVAVKVPGVVLRYDAEGKLLSRAERAEAPQQKQE